MIELDEAIDPETGGFNEAGAVRPRKSSEQLRDRDRTQLASMRPGL